MQIDGTLLITIVGSIASIAVAWGIVKATVSALEKRMDAAEVKLGTVATSTTALEQQAGHLERRACEDREHNQGRFQELYISRNEMQSQISEMVASVNSLCQRYDRLEPKLDEIIQELATLKAKVCRE